MFARGVRLILVLTVFVLFLIIPTRNDLRVDAQANFLGTTERVSVATDSTQANEESLIPSISDDGRYVAFESYASNLIIGDTNEEPDVFVHDRQLHTTTRVSVATNGVQGNSAAGEPSISGDGRYVAFYTKSSNLFGGDTNEVSDVYVHDRQTGETFPVSISSGGDIGDLSSFSASISADGRYVAFASRATNLVSEDINDNTDVFVHDTQTGETEIVSIASSGEQKNGSSVDPSISANGRYVAFTSSADFMGWDGNAWADVYVHDRQTGETYPVSVSSNGYVGSSWSYGPSISADGRYVVFLSRATSFVSGDTNGLDDVYIHDLQTSETFPASISAEGEFGNRPSEVTSISADGRYVAFGSSASNLVTENTYGTSTLFIFDVQNRMLSLTSLFPGPRGINYDISISGNGRYISFASYSSFFVWGDTNEITDIFVHDREGFPSRYSISGVLLDNEGYPLADVMIQDEFEHQVYTNEDGVFVFAGLTAGSYTLTPSIEEYTFSPSSRAVSVPPNQINQDFVGVQTTQIPDLWIDEVVPTQVIDINNLPTNLQYLVSGKSTAIKVTVHKSGVSPINDVPVLLTLGSYQTNRFFVAESANLDNNRRLINDDQEFQLNFGEGDGEKTVYFFGSELSPSQTTYQGTATVNPNRDIPESDYSNNSKSTSLYPVRDINWGVDNHPELHIHYLSADFSNQDFQEFQNIINYNDRYLKGLLPVSNALYKPSVSSVIQGSTTGFYNRGFDGKFNKGELGAWMSKIQSTLILAHRTADRYIVVVPSGWFIHNTTEELQGALGVSDPKNLPHIILAEGLVFSRPNGFPTIPHEIGHTLSLPSGECTEEYDEGCSPTGINGIGNYSGPGVFVDARVPIINVPSDGEVICIMGRANPLIKPIQDWEYWIDTNDYAAILTKLGRTLTSRDTLSASGAILVTGEVSLSGSAELHNWYVLDDAEISQLIPGPYRLEYRDSENNLLNTIDFDVSFTFDGTPVTQAAFSFTIPFIEGTSRIDFVNSNTLLAQKQVSAHDPKITNLTPLSDIEVGNSVMIEWNGTDEDGDTLTYTVLVSADNGINWEALETDLLTGNYLWNTSSIEAGLHLLVKVIATDGFNSSELVSTGRILIEPDNSLYFPVVFNK